MTFVAGQRPVAPWGFHHWWGKWSTAAELPNVAGSATQWGEIQAGDAAWVVASGGAMYLCTDPTPGAAIWVSVPTGAAGGCCDLVPLVYQPGGTPSDNVYTDFGLLYTEAATRTNPVVLIDGSFMTPTIPAGVYNFSGWTFRSAGLEQTQLVFMDGVNATITSGYGPIAFDNLNVALDAGNMTASPFRLRPISYGSVLQVYATDTSFTGDAVSITPVGVFHAAPIVGASTLNITLRGLSYANEFTTVADNTSGIVNVGLFAYDVGTVAPTAIAGTATDLDRSQYSTFTSLPPQSGLTVTGTSTYDATNATKERHVLNGEQTGVVELHIGSVYFPQDTVLLADSKAQIGTVGGGAETATLNLRDTLGNLYATWTATGTLQEVTLAADVELPSNTFYNLYIVGGGVAQVAQARGLYLFFYGNRTLGGG
jgi:hypothetical protein